MNWKLLGLAIVGGLIAKKTLSDKDKNRCQESGVYYEDDEDVITPYKSKKEELYQVRIKGTLQCNGPKIIDKTFVADKVQAQMFQGSKRYEAIEGWIRANYPAAKPQSSYRNFGVEVKRLK